MHVFHHGQIAEQGKLLGDIPDLLSDGVGIAHRIKSQDRAFALGAAEQAQDDAGEGGLSGSIRADQAKSLPLLDLQVDVIDRRDHPLAGFKLFYKVFSDNRVF